MAMNEERYLEIAHKAGRRRLRADRARVSEMAAEVFRHLDQHLFDVGFGVAELRRALGSQASEFLRAFSAELRMPAGRYLARLRLAGGLQLIARTNLPFSRISSLCGWSSPRDLVGACREDFGLTPKELRRQARAEWPHLIETEMVEETAKAESTSEPSSLKRSLAGALSSWLMKRPGIGGERLSTSVLRFGDRALFEHLVEASRQEGRRDRERGVEVTRLLVSFVEGSRDILGSDGKILEVLAHAWLGNAQRLASDFLGAEASLHLARVSLSRIDGGFDPLIEAQLDLFVGTLRLFERRFSEARELLDRAVERAEREGDADLEANARLQRASTAIDEGRPLEALQDLRTAVSLLDGRFSINRRDLLGARQNLALICAETGEVDEAHGHLVQARALCSELRDEPSRVALLWIAGLIAGHRGDLDEAERHFRQARADFLKLNDIYCTALAALDLAILLRRHGRKDEVIELVTRDVLPVLENLRLDDECITALTLLEQSLSVGSVSTKGLRKARKSLRHHSSIDD